MRDFLRKTALILVGLVLANIVYARSPKMVIFGNSITENWVKFHPAFFEENGFKGCGISGETTSQMLLRFEDNVVKTSPQMVLILGGINDIAENDGPYTEDKTFSNISEMARIAADAGIEVYLGSVLPTSNIYWRKSIENVPDKIDSLNDRIRGMAAEKGYTYVDFNSHLAMPDRSLNPELTKDGLHPTPPGYTVMEALLLPILP
ncbi:MAG: acylhydrolase [Muribaculaceae bacterium]|nr:acylhydrolase [Muribaculaceae bacterium]